MKRIIHRAQAFFARFNSLSQKQSRSYYLAKTPIRTHDILRASPSQSQEILKARISHRLSTHYWKNTQPIPVTHYQVTAIWKNGPGKVYCFGTWYQAVRKANRLLMTGTNGVTLQRKSSPAFPHREGSYLLFSERWPNVISTVLISQPTRSSPFHTHHRAAPLIQEHHSSGRVYSHL